MHAQIACKQSEAAEDKRSIWHGRERRRLLGRAATQLLPSPVLAAICSSEGLRLRAETQTPYNLTRMEADEFKIHFRVSRTFFRMVRLLDETTTFHGHAEQSAEMHFLVMFKQFGFSGNGAIPNKLADFLYWDRNDYVGRKTGSSSAHEHLARGDTVTRRRKKSCLISYSRYLPVLELHRFRRWHAFPSRVQAAALRKGLVFAQNEPRSHWDYRVQQVLHQLHQRWQHDNFFHQRQYLLGDSACKPSSFLVPAFKQPHRRPMPTQHKFFISLLVKARIRVEHAIGMLKWRFQMLKKMRTRIAQKEDMKRFVRFVTAAVAVHNLALGDSPPACDPDSDSDDESSDGDSENIEEEVDGVTKLQQILNYLLEGFEQ